MQAENGVQSAVFENGALRIEYAAGCAYLDGEELHLTPIEYKLLCLLSQNAGKVLTHTFITQKNLGKQLGERYRFPPCFHGDASEKAGKERRADAVYPDAYRGWLPDAEGRVKEEKNLTLQA